MFVPEAEMRLVGGGDRPSRGGWIPLALEAARAYVRCDVGWTTLKCQDGSYLAFDPACLLWDLRVYGRWPR